VGQDGGGYKSDLRNRRRGKFLQRGLDSQFTDLPVGLIAISAGSNEETHEVGLRAPTTAFGARPRDEKITRQQKIGHGTIIIDRH
jgi:hypothetical protein